MSHQEPAVDVKEGDNPQKKQKISEDSGRLLQRTESKGRFKVLGHLVLAAKRFQASLNPKYTYGKKPEDHEHDGGHVPPGRTTGPTTRSMSSRTETERTASGRPVTRPGSGHGHKAALLFKPLAPVEQEV